MWSTHHLKKSSSWFWRGNWAEEDFFKFCVFLRKSKLYWKSWLSLSNRSNQQIKPHPTRWHYPLITYLLRKTTAIWKLVWLDKIFIKGQINSEWIYEIINFPKNNLKNLKDSCLMYYKNSQGRNPSNFSGHFLENVDFINSFWLNLTLIFCFFNSRHSESS